MSALNSFSLAHPFSGSIPTLIIQEVHERVLGTKGLFIVPYTPGRKVAFVRCECDVISTVNESRTMWSNPEIGFYGYCHVRYYKQSVGNPVQLNQRNQILHQWFPYENIVSINERQSYKRLQGLVEFPLVDENAWYLLSPGVTDYTFGLQREGKIRVKVTIGYFDERLFVFDPYGPPIQDVPNPFAVGNIDPGQYKDLGDPLEPLSPPYRPDNLDFGESLPGIPPDPSPEGEFRQLRWGTEWTNIQTQQPQQAGNGNSSVCDLKTPITSVSEPIVAPGRAYIYHSVVDAVGVRDLQTASLSTLPQEAQEQIDNYVWSIEPCNPGGN